MSNELNDIIASSVHDMKNSVGMILSSLESISDGCGDGSSCQCEKSQVAQLQYEAKRVNRNLMQLLTLYRIDSGHYRPSIDEHGAHELLEEAYLFNKPLLDLHSTEVKIDCDEALMVYCDRTLLLSLLDNLITNSLRYSNKKMHLIGKEKDGFIVFSVEDDGEGYPAEMLDNFQTHMNGIDFKSGSTGVGLYFSKKIAEMHKNGDQHGSVNISNGGSLGGAVFEVMLPA